MAGFILRAPRLLAKYKKLCVRNQFVEAIPRNAAFERQRPCLEIGV